ncbi:SDR family oxidoreductase [Stieleria varia]|uniref:Enoyl-[acyl-carrier-protein] reductase [NADPH] FabL n=1 Tax=Stieleria varia TaxID=2528005 RepID=A0A5C6AFZ7_9BACT|nr:SDR family oxidoreductase [Stieleria varia]TWT98529.1 Enoyl-[acyl-carrier-protein] reductase [NADPH] FabL [Stieleria varia]
MLKNEDIFSRVVNCISATTRYPIVLLTEQADLENDLGIDSVKRLEIVVALEEAFGLRLSDRERDPSIRSIGDIARWIEEIVFSQGTENPVVADSVRQDRVPFPRGETATQPSRQLNDNTTRRESDFHRDPPQSISPPHFTPGTPPLENASVGKTLAGRVALVTGSGRGIGRVIARVLASKGATVIVNSFHSREAGEQTAAEINAQGGSAIHLWGSVANVGHLDQIFSQIKSRFGRLDILVCNASDGRIGAFMELTPDDWDRAFRTNVIGHHQCAVMASELMRGSGGGSIITMSAVGAKGWVDGLGSQGVVKAAVETMTRYLACELAPFGIRSNCVVGGPVYGDLLDKFPNARNAQDHWETHAPDGNLCSPLELANAIAFLVSDDASGINGSVWVVDHGFSAVANGQPKRVGEAKRVMSSR